MTSSGIEPAALRLVATCMRTEVCLYEDLTSAIDGDGWSASRPDRFTLGEGALGIHCTGHWMSARACLNGTKKRKSLPLPGIKLRFPGLRTRI
jgi:hypothetical protein